MGVEELRATHDLPIRETTITVDADALEGIQSAVDRGVDCWVSAVVTDDDGRVLLVRNGWSDGWIPPGGDVEPGETPREAAARETREETGVDVSVAGPVAVVEGRFVCDGRAVEGTRVGFAATAETTALAEDPGLEREGIAEVGWFGTLPGRMEQRWLLERGLAALD